MHINTFINNVFMMIAVFLFVPTAYSNEPSTDGCKNNNSYYTFIWENDSFASGGDRHYTNGMKLSWLNYPCESEQSGLIKPTYASLVKSFTDPFTDKEWKVDLGGVFGINMYTPNNIRTSVRQRNDRPFVGWLYGGVLMQAMLPSEKQEASLYRAKAFVSTEIQIGVVGPRAGQGRVQTFIHQDLHLSDNIPNGWQNQVSNRPGAVVLTSFSTNYFYDGPVSKKKFIRVTPMAGITAGNIIQFVSAGAMLAVGRPSDSFVNSTIKPAVKHMAHFNNVQKPKSDIDSISVNKEEISDKGWHYDIHTGFDHRYIFNSIFVEGAGEAKHDIDLVHHVYDTILGFSASHGNFMFSWSRIRRSVEFTSSDPSVVKAHVIGQVIVEWKF